MAISAYHSSSFSAFVRSVIQRVLKKFGYAFHRADILEHWEARKCPGVKPGHFYSPHPDLKEIRRQEASIFSYEKEVLDIDFRESEQLQILQALASLQPTITFPKKKSSGFRYYFHNPAYSYADALVLHGMLRLIKPQRLIEVGCGYSSAMALDTNELCFQNSIKMTFIEPHPQLLHELAKPEDKERITIIPSRLQDLSPEFFSQLEKGDVLFIDSTHVSKVNSDVNFIFFEILPRLNAGVYIHFHDIFYPFEYPKEFVYDGRAWQELYILRAFLQNNPCYEIVYFQDFLFRKHRLYFEQHLPLFMKHGGAQIWLRKVH